jgi:hypothetical protein
MEKKITISVKADTRSIDRMVIKMMEKHNKSGQYCVECTGWFKGYRCKHYIKKCGRGLMSCIDARAENMNPDHTCPKYQKAPPNYHPHKVGNHEETTEKEES